MTAMEQLKEEIKRLPEPMAREVLDFLLFLRQKERNSGVTDIYARTAGAWKGELLERAPQGIPARTLSGTGRRASNEDRRKGT